MNFDFSQAMKQASNVELIRIVTIARGDYQESAILAAEEEIARRNLSDAEVEKLKQVNNVKKNIEDAKANEPLDLHWKILTLIFPMIFTFILSGYYKSEGYDKKGRDLVKWTFLGFGFYISLIIIISLLG